MGSSSATRDFKKDPAPMCIVWYVVRRFKAVGLGGRETLMVQL